MAGGQRGGAEGSLGLGHTSPTVPRVEGQPSPSALPARHRGPIWDLGRAVTFPRGHGGWGKPLASALVPGGWCPPSRTWMFIQGGSAAGLNRHHRCCSLAQDQRPPRELRAHRWQVEAGGGEGLAMGLSDPMPQLLLFLSLLPSKALGSQRSPVVPALAKQPLGQAAQLAAHNSSPPSAVPPQRLHHRPLHPDGHHHAAQADHQQRHGVSHPVSFPPARGALAGAPAHSGQRPSSYRE